MAGGGRRPRIAELARASSGCPFSGKSPGPRSRPVQPWCSPAGWTILATCWGVVESNRAAAVERFGGLDVVVSNSGFADRTRVAAMTDADFARSNDARSGV